MLPALKVVIGADTKDFDKGIKNANAKLKSFSKAAAAAAALVGVATAALVAKSLSGIDSQAKLAQSLQTTVRSMQILARAGQLAGVEVSQLEGGTKDLTRRLSQAAASGGPVADALERLKLNANDLLKIPLDERIDLINSALIDFIPAAEQAAVAGQLFGEEGSLALTRIDSETLRQATKDLEDFGAIVSEQDAAQIERTNDAISRLGLIATGFGNQIAVAVAPSLERLADVMASVASVSGPLGQALQLLLGNLDRIAITAAVFAAAMAGKFVIGLAAATLSVKGLAFSLTVLRGALIRTGIGALIVGAGELVYWFSKLVKNAGSFADAMGYLKTFVVGVWDKIGEAFGILITKTKIGWQTIKGNVADSAISMIESMVDMANNIANIFQGMYLGIKETFLQLPLAISNAIKKMINALIKSIKIGLNEVMSATNQFINKLNTALKAVGMDPIGKLDQFSEADINTSTLIVEAQNAGAAVRDAFNSGFDENVISNPALKGLHKASGGAFDSGLKSEAKLKEQEDQFEKPINGLQALRDMLVGASTEAASVGPAMAESLAAVDTAVSTTGQIVPPIIEKIKSDWEKTGDAISGSFETAMMSAVDGTMKLKDAFKSMASSIIKELYRIYVIKKITGMITKAFGGTPVTAEGGASFAGGGYTGNGTRAGGIDGKGGFPAILHPRETVIDHTAKGSGPQGGVVVNQTINVSAGVAQTVRTEMMSLLPIMAQQAKGAVLDSKRRGGSYGGGFA